MKLTIDQMVNRYQLRRDGSSRGYAIGNWQAAKADGMTDQITAHDPADVLAAIDARSAAHAARCTTEAKRASEARIIQPKRGPADVLADPRASKGAKYYAWRQLQEDGIYGAPNGPTGPSEANPHSRY